VGPGAVGRGELKGALRDGKAGRAKLDVSLEYMDRTAEDVRCGAVGEAGDL